MDYKQISDQKQIDLIIERLALQILETIDPNIQIVLLGIEKNGFILAKNIYYKIKELNEKVSVDCSSLQIDKNNLITSEIFIDRNIKDFDNKGIILIDDVINSGKTLFYAFKGLLNCDFEFLRILVLVERIYKKTPIKADFVGISLNTTFLNHIHVDNIENKLISINLN